ncbi:hypothetical protein [Bacillus thuringiensis]|uniref:hypothetical protein n=1 Tax=Bacillus thuringiensis TaxID=1428 RepID=UPI001F52A457|nr:hypothetical protein [Bacillus thuringiensis]
MLKYVNGEPTEETKRYLLMKEDLRKLEDKYGLEKYGVYNCRWEEIQAFYESKEINYTHVEHIYNVKRCYDTSLLNTKLVDGEIVEREENPRLKLARAIRRAL